MAHQCDIMKKTTLIGSILAVVLLVLAMVPNVNSAQTTTAIGKIHDTEIVDSKNVNTQKDVLYDPPGWWLRVLRDFLLSIFVWFYINIWANLGN